MAKNAESLDFYIDIDGARAQKVMAQFDKRTKSAMKSIQRATLLTDKGMNRLFKTSHRFGTDFAKGMKLGTKEVQQLNMRIKAMPALIAKATRAEKDHEKAISSTERQLNVLKKTLKEYKAAGNKEKSKGYAEMVEAAEAQLKSEKASLSVSQERTRAIEKQKSVLEDIEKMQGTANLGRVFTEAADDMAMTLRKETEEMFKDLVMFDSAKTTKGLSEAFQEAASSLSGRDLKGLAGGLGKMLGTGLKGAGGAATRMGAKAQMDPAMGGMAKALGGIVGKMGPLLNTMAKLGPMLGAIGGGIMALVKLFIDADAAAKEFNQELLATASTGEFLSKSAGNVNIAYDKLNDTITSIRDSASQAFGPNGNLAWGTTKKDHLAVLNVLNAEGVSLDRISTEAEKAKKEVGAFSADMVHVAVAYSRNFGVSLNEISSFQAEMMTDLGASFGTAQKQFAMMQTSAGEAGMAQNKFFNIIKSVSTDLSLYNMRMEEAVHMLTLLGKVMNPRNAAKFLQQTMQGFKNMGRTEKLKMTLLAGAGDTAKIVERDLKRKSKGIAEQISEATGGKADDIQAMIMKGDPKVRELIKQMPKEQQGALQDAVSQIKIDSKRSKRGLFGLSGATGNLGAGGVLEMYKKSIGRFGGGKKLSDSAGSIGGEMMAEQLGVSQEQLDQAIKFEQAIDDQKDVLKEAIDKSSDSDAEKAKKKAKIDKMETDEVLDTMSKEDKEAMNNAGKQIDYAKQQGDLTQSILQKIEVIMDWLLNQVYKVMTGIFDTITDIYDSITIGHGEEKARKKMEVALAKTGNKTLMDQFANFTGTTEEFEKTLRQQISPESIASAVSDVKGREEDLESKKFAMDPAKFEEESKKLQEERKAAEGKQAAVRGALDKTLGTDPADREAAAKRAMASSGMDMQDPTFASKIGQGMSPTDAASAAGLDPGKVDQFYQGLAQLTDRKKLTEIASSATGGAGGAASPTGQAAAAQKAAPPGGAAPIPGMAPSEGAAAGGGGAGGAPSAPAKAQEEQTKVASDQLAQMQAIQATQQATGDKAVDAIDFMQQSMKKGDVKLNKPWMKNEFQKRVEDAVLDAARVALLEYHLYSGLDRTELLATGASGTDIPRLVDEMRKAGSAKAIPGTFKAEAHADGGTVLSPAPGEVMASVAPGETIVPKGGGVGGGGTINQSFAAGVDPAFARYIKQKTQEAVIEWNSKNKLR